MDEDDQLDEPSDSDRRMSVNLLRQLEGGLVIDFVEAIPHEVAGHESIEIKLKISEDDVETSAFGLIFTIASLSFQDSLPAGYSKKLFQFHDEYRVEDFLPQLKYHMGRLWWSSDYVRGRRMKTTVVIDREGNVGMTVLDRGHELPMRWVELILQLRVEAENEGEA